METEKYDWTPESGQAYDEDEDGSPYQPLDSVEDAELLRKRRELELIEKQIASKKAALASKKTVFPRPSYGEKDPDAAPVSCMKRPGERRSETSSQRVFVESDNTREYSTPKQDEAGAKTWRRQSERTPPSPDEAGAKTWRRQSERTPPSPDEAGAKTWRRQSERTPPSPDEAGAKTWRRQSERTPPSPDGKSPGDQLDFFSMYRSKPPAAKRESPTRGFDRFLSILNRGVDEGKLSEMARATKSRDHRGDPSRDGDRWPRDNNDDRYPEDREQRSERGERSDWRQGRSQNLGSSDGWSGRRDSERERERERHWDSRGRSQDGERHLDPRERDWDRERYLDPRDRDRYLDSRDRDRNFDSRERERYLDSRDRDGDRHFDSRDRDRNWDSRDGERNWESRDRDRNWDSRDRDRHYVDTRQSEAWDSREGSRAWKSREQEWSQDLRDTNRGGNSAERKRSIDSRERGDRDPRDQRFGSRETGGEVRDQRVDSRDSREKDRNSREQRLDSKEGDERPREPEKLDSTRERDDHRQRLKPDDWEQERASGIGNQKHEDRNSREPRRDSLSPGRRGHSSDRRSRTRSPVLSKEELERRTEKEEQFARIQSLLQTVGLELGIEDVDRLNSRTHERLYGAKLPTDEPECSRQQGAPKQHRDSTSSDRAQQYSPDSTSKTHDPQKNRGHRDDDEQQQQQQQQQQQRKNNRGHRDDDEEEEQQQKQQRKKSRGHRDDDEEQQQPQRQQRKESRGRRDDDEEQQPQRQRSRRRHSKRERLEEPSEIPAATAADYATYHNWYNRAYHSSYMQSWAAAGWAGAVAYDAYGNPVLGSPPSTSTGLALATPTGAYGDPHQLAAAYAYGSPVALASPFPQQASSQDRPFLKPLQEVSLEAEPNAQEQQRKPQGNVTKRPGNVTEPPPPGTEPTGTEPPGTEPPGTEPPGTEPTGKKPMTTHRNVLETQGNLINISCLKRKNTQRIVEAAKEMPEAMCPRRLMAIISAQRAHAIVKENQEKKHKARAETEAAANAEIAGPANEAPTPSANEAPFTSANEAPTPPANEAPSTSSDKDTAAAAAVPAKPVIVLRLKSGVLKAKTDTLGAGT